MKKRKGCKKELGTHVWPSWVCMMPSTQLDGFLTPPCRKSIETRYYLQLEQLWNIHFQEATSRYRKHLYSEYSHLVQGSFYLDPHGQSMKSLNVSGLLNAVVSVPSSEAASAPAQVIENREEVSDCTSRWGSSYLSLSKEVHWRCFSFPRSRSFLKFHAQINFVWM